MIARHRRRRGADATSSACSRTRASRTAATCSSALVAGNDVGKAAILFYLLAYAVTNLGAFGVIALLGTRDRPNDELRDYAGPVARRARRWPR